MRLHQSSRGFWFLLHPEYLKPHEESRLVAESSATTLERGPGEEFLWVGEDHHLDREEVTELRDALTRWLETGRLMVAPSPDEEA